jgi:hypothetical protein
MYPRQCLIDARELSPPRRRSRGDDYVNRLGVRIEHDLCFSAFQLAMDVRQFLLQGDFSLAVIRALA